MKNKRAGKKSKKEADEKIKGLLETG